MTTVLADSLDDLLRVGTFICLASSCKLVLLGITSDKEYRQFI